jgi:hypothetical protein
MAYEGYEGVSGFPNYPRTTTSDAFNGRVILVPILLSRRASDTAPRGTKGWTKFARWPSTNLGGDFDRPKTLNVASSRDWLVMYDLAFPWDGTTPTGEDGNFNAELLDPNPAADTTPPVITFVPPGSPTSTSIFKVEVTDDSSFVGLITIWLEFTGGSELVYDGVNFGPAYQGASNQVVPITDGFRVEFTRDGGWTNSPMTINVTAEDHAGNQSDDSTVFSPAVVAQGPTVTILSPSAGTPILRSQPLSFQLLDTLHNFRRILPVVMFPGLPILELVHDGENFTSLYEAGSTRSAIANGFQYTIFRKNGWPDAPTLIPFAFDVAGFETQ